MKKLLIGGLVLVLLLVIAVVVGIAFFLDSGIKRGVETYGPQLTGTTVKLDSASLSILSGSGKLNGLVIGNPEGYKKPSAISLGSGSLVVQPGSIFSDKVIVKSINIQAPEITLETDLKSSNLQKILDNLNKATGGGSTPKTEAPPKSGPNKKLQVDEFIIAGGKVHVSVNNSLVGVATEQTVELPEIKFTSLGTGPDGITSAELSSKVLKAIIDKSLEVGLKIATTTGKDAAIKEINKAVGEKTGGQISNALDSVRGFLKKKK